MVDESPLPLSCGSAEEAAFLETTRVVFRSCGCGVWGVMLRWLGMPLEKMALFANSSQVAGRGQLKQAVRLTFRDGPMAPYRVVGVASVVSWFLQYSTMVMVFQVCDRALSKSTGIKPVAYGDELQQPQLVAETTLPKAAKDLAAALAAAAIESTVSNRAEAQRFYGLRTFAAIECNVLGPAFAASMSRNAVMAYSAFVITPVAYCALPDDWKQRPGSFFYFALGVNMFVGNGVAVTQQALWGHSLEQIRRQKGGSVSYSQVARQAWAADGIRAFITPAKWGTRILMNAPAEGTLAWFYNTLLPIPEPAVLVAASVFFRRYIAKPPSAGNKTR